MADKALLRLLVEAAEKAGDKMLPEDVEHLLQWGLFIKILRSSIQNSEEKA